MRNGDQDTQLETQARSKETQEETIARLTREKENMESQNQGFIGAMVLCGLFLLLTLGFGCQIDAPSARY